MACCTQIAAQAFVISGSALRKREMDNDAPINDSLCSGKGLVLTAWETERGFQMKIDYCNYTPTYPTLAN